jgi:mono/diheme cytochrome c family protein
MLIMKKNRFKEIIAIMVIGILIVSCSRTNNTNQMVENDSLQNLKNAKTDSLALSDTIAGKKIYESYCMVCHQANGNGISGTFPPLANADYLLADKHRSLKQLIHGFKDSVMVNGIYYRGNVMPDIDLTDEQVKNVMNYILNSWGNNGGFVTLDEVRQARNN